MTSPVLRAQGLCKTYRKGVRALVDVNLDVQAGELVGILGPNGAGKTTFLKAALGIVRPTRGELRLFDRPAGDPESRKDVGYLPENHRFPLHLTARQALDIYGRMGLVEGALRKARTAELMERVGLTDWIDRRIGTYSKGMMQRLGLAQALLGQPKLLVLDEPTDGVDPVGRRDIRDILRELHADGITILLNSHLLAEVEQICNRVVVLNKGETLYDGPTTHLVADSRACTIRFRRQNETDDDTISFDTLSDEELNTEIDRLRAQQALIVSIERPSHSLESQFITLLEG